MDKTLRNVLIGAASLCLAVSAFYAGVFAWLYIEALCCGLQALGGAMTRNAAGFVLTVLLPLFLGLMLILAMCSHEKKIEAAASAEKTEKILTEIREEARRKPAEKPEGKRKLFGRWENR